MNNRNKKAINFYVLFILLFLFISSVIIYIKYNFKDYFNNSIWIVQGFFFIIIIGSHAIAEVGLKKKDEFHTFYLAAMAMRFLLSIIFIFIVLFKFDQNPVIFIVAFFILYLVYTSFEIYLLLRNLRTDLKSDGAISKKY